MASSGSVTTGGCARPPTFISYGFPIISQMILQRRGRHVPGPFTLGAWSKPVTLIASVWIVLELINVWWPRYPDLPWYQNWGVLLVTVILTVVGFIAYAFAPRHDFTVGGTAPPVQDLTTVPDATMSE